MDETNAKKRKFSKRDLSSLLSDVDQLFVAKGKSFSRFDLKSNPPDKSTLEKLLLGPTGNLRAPTIRNGKTLIVGFNDEMYRQAII